MDGISRTSGVGPTIKICGRTLTVQARILRHHAEIEAEIISRRGNPFDLIRQAVDALKDCPDVLHEFTARAFEEARKWRVATLDDIGEFLEETWAGFCFAIWLAVRHNSPDLTLELVTQMCSDEFESRLRKGGPAEAAKWRAELHDALNQANGDDELGNSTGSEPGETPASEVA